MVAARPGLMSPTLFVQHVNTFSTLAQGRISLNIVAGHSPEEQRYYGDHLAHDDRYERLEEWLRICLAFWKGEGTVEHSGKYYRIEGGRLNTPFWAAAGHVQSCSSAGPRRKPAELPPATRTAGFGSPIRRKRSGSGAPATRGQHRGRAPALGHLSINPRGRDSRRKGSRRV